MASLRLLALVDDDSSFRDVLAEMLQAEDYEVRCFADGKPLEAALRGGWLPDLILLDIMTAEISGLDILNWLAAHPTYREIPIFIISTAAEFPVQPAIPRVKAYFMKPFDFNELLIALREWFASGRTPLRGTSPENRPFRKRLRY